MNNVCARVYEISLNMCVCLYLGQMFFTCFHYHLSFFDCIRVQYIFYAVLTLAMSYFCLTLLTIEN